jgi:exonuclease SbcD
METIKILHSADWHLSQRGNVAGRFVLENGINITLLDRIKALEKICEYVESENVDLTVIAGDLFDNANPENIAIRAAVQTIERLAEVAPVVLIRGNHDGKSSTSSALAPFGTLARRNGIYVFEQPEVFSLIIKDTKVQIFVHPYPRRSDFQQDPQLKLMSPEEISIHISGKLEETISGFSSMIERDAVNILVGHFTVGGGSYSKEQNVPVFDVSVREEFLAPFDIVCLGHLHAPQPYYSGSIARNGFGEQDQKVGFKVYDIQPGEKPIEQFIELPAREYVTVNPEEFLKDGHFSPDAAVRVKGKIPKHEYDEIIRKMKALNMPFLKNAIEIESDTAGGNGGDTSEELSLEEAIKLWATSRDGIALFLDRLILAAQEVEGIFNEAKK